MEKWKKKENGFEDKPEEEFWQFEVRRGNQGWEKRRCWNPNCKKRRRKRKINYGTL